MTGGRLIHLGNAVVDVVVQVPHLPPRGGDVLATGSFPAVGGGFNVMAAAARQGMEVVYAGMHGAGEHGDLVRAALAAEQIRVLQPPLTDLDTGTVLTLVEADGERTFVTVPGAEARLSREALARVDIAASDVVYVTGYSLAHETNRTALLEWLPTLPEAATLVVDPGPLVATLPRDAVTALLARADWCTANAAEAMAVTGEPNPARAAAALARLTGRAGVVVRIGAGGCLVAEPGQPVLAVPGVVVVAVDLNGAGDTHTGVFLASLAQGADAIEAAREANAAAAMAVTRRGPATAPSRSELQASRATAQSS